jgi:hypothetical protein
MVAAPTKGEAGPRRRAATGTSRVARTAVATNARTAREAGGMPSCSGGVQVGALPVVAVTASRRSRCQSSTWALKLEGAWTTRSKGET